LNRNHYYVAKKILKFLELFYDSTFVLSDVYYPTSLLVLHHILEIASHLHACKRDQNLRVVVAPMKLKFLKYWENIPLLCSYAFILYLRAKMRGFFNVLQLLGECTGSEYSSYYADVKIELYKMFNKYENKLVQLGLKGLHNHQFIQVRKSRHGEGSLEAVVDQDQVLLVLLPCLCHLIFIYLCCL
jgi:hypothetical protein